MSKQGQKKRTVAARIRRIALYAVLAVVLLIAVTLLTTQTRPFKNWLRDFAVDTVNESLNGELSIGEINGNLIGNIELDRVNITMGADTVVKIASIRTQYSLFDLLSDVIKVDSLHIDSLYVLAEQLNDSTWNLAGIAKADSTKPVEDTVETSFDYKVVLSDFRLTDASIDVKSPDSLIPAKLEDIGVHLAAKYSSELASVTMHSLHLRSSEPDLLIDTVKFEAESDSESFSLKDFVLKTAVNRITSSATIFPDTPKRNLLSVDADTLKLSEFEHLLSQFVSEPMPVLNVHVETRNDSATADISIMRQAQIVDLEIASANISTLLDTSLSQPLSYDMVMLFDQVSVGEWIDNPEVDLLVNGRLQATGEGIDAASARLTLDGQFDRCIAQQDAPFALNIGAMYDSGDARGNLSIPGHFGEIKINGQISSLLETAKYDLGLSTSNLNLAKLGLSDTLDSDLNLELTLVGEGFTPETAVGSAEIFVSQSRAMNLQADTGAIVLSYSPDMLIIDTASFVTRAVDIGVSGTLSKNNNSDLRFWIELKDIAALNELTGGMDLSGTGMIEGTVSGNYESMLADAKIELSGLQMEDNGIRSIIAEVNGEYQDSILTGSVRMHALDINSGDMLIDSVGLVADYEGDEIDLSISARHGSEFHVAVDSRVNLDSTVSVLLHDLSLGYKHLHWSGGSDSTRLVLDSSVYRVEYLRLSSDDPAGGSISSVSVDGIVDLEGNSDVTAVISDLDLKPLGVALNEDISGLVSADVHLSGPSDRPSASGNLLIEQLHYQNFDINTIRGGISHDGARASIDLHVVPTAPDTFAVTGTLPLAFSLSDSIANERVDSLIDIRVRSPRLSLAMLKGTAGLVDRADGLFSCDFMVTNTLADPRINGTISLRKGQFTLPDYGIEYKDIFAEITCTPDKILLDSLIIHRDKGKLRVDGYLEYDSSLITGDIRSTQMDLVADKFFAVRHRDYEVQLSSNISLTGADSSAGYSGSLTVNRSRFYLPALIEQAGTDALDRASLPMLVAATYTDTTAADRHSNPGIVNTTDPDSARSAFMDRLTGNLKVVIPKNTWIKSPDLSLELSGNLEVVKDGVDFELFGDISVVRGHYELYGKRFTVVHGKLVFSGGADYVAGLDIEAKYKFRTASREKKTMHLIVGGTSELPEISFSLDETSVSEGDAMSYILFGRSLDELSQGQRSSIAESGGSSSLAGSAAASLLAGQLSSVLGNRLNLDVIEIKADGDLQSAAVVVGKYLTPDLFMSYQRSFGSAQDNDLEPETVTLEYQLTRVLYLQLTEGDAEEAGVDVVTKFQVE